MDELYGIKQEKRTADRLPIAVGSCITLRGWPLMNAATTLNVSTTGAMIRFEEPIDLALGDVVTCDFEVADGELRMGALPNWARGEVIRVEGTDVALHFLETSFCGAEGRVLAA